jgi:hypothetical protein
VSGSGKFRDHSVFSCRNQFATAHAPCDKQATCLIAVNGDVFLNRHNSHINANRCS